MRRLITLLTLAAFSILPAKSERLLETVLEDVDYTQQNTIYNGKVVIAGNGSSYFLTYDDESFSRINFPILDGLQLSYTTVYPLTNFESSVFVALGRSGTPFRITELYRYSDRTFTRIPITGTIKSNYVVYGSYLYFLTDVSGTVKLFRYSRGVISEVARGDIPRSREYRLMVEGGSLYITGTGGIDGYFNFILRYTGGSFFTITSDLHGPAANKIFVIPGTDRFYFTSQYHVYYFNGRSIVHIFSNAVAVIIAKIMGNDLVFIAASGSRHDPGPTLLYKVSGATLTNLTLPTGHYISTERPCPETYRGSFYFGAFTSDGRAEVLRYDGTSFSTFFTFPASETFAEFNIIMKEDELIIQGQIDYYHSRTYSYNGIVTEEIIAPAGHYIYLQKSSPGVTGPLIKSTVCNHLWQISDPNSGSSPYAYAKESRGCPVPPPPPPPPGPVGVIPDHFMIHERFEALAIGRDRGWCWNEIIFGWDTIPICPVPPCPEPNYQLRMIDINDKIAWSESFGKPSKFEVPLKDDQPFGTILSSADNKSDLLIFDPDLVPKGIEEIKLLMVPKKGFITISVSTRKKESVPLRVALLDEEGKEIWMQTFTAPFSMQITATVQKAGKTLVFSIPDDGMKFITRRDKHF